MNFDRSTESALEDFQLNQTLMPRYPLEVMLLIIGADKSFDGPQSISGAAWPNSSVASQILLVNIMEDRAVEDGFDYTGATPNTFGQIQVANPSNRCAYSDSWPNTLICSQHRPSAASTPLFICENIQNTPDEKSIPSSAQVA